LIIQLQLFAILSYKGRENLFFNEVQVPNNFSCEFHIEENLYTEIKLYSDNVCIIVSLILLFFSIYALR